MSNVPLRTADDQQVELISTIIEKTKEGRLRWRRDTISYEADLPDGGQIAFFLASPRLLGGQTWARFIVSRLDGTEILNVQHTDVSTLLEGIFEAPLENAASELFTIVNESAKIEVDKFIEQLKKL